MSKLFKGFTACLIFILFFICTPKTNATYAYFVWEKTEIVVPVFSNLDEYKDDYVVRLYVDGVESFDFTVEAEVNCSTFSTVLTHTIGKYTVYYKAYSKNNYVSSMMPIIFNVVDVTRPTIKINEDPVVVQYGHSLADYDWYEIADDISKVDELSVFIDDSCVIYNTVGTYPATIKVTDLTGNFTEVDFSVKVIDTEKPKILILKPLEFSYGEQIDVSQYFLCKDNYNNDITHLLEISALDTLKLGKQEILLSVTDYSNNSNQVLVEVVVVDKIKPVLILTQQEITLDICYYKEYNWDYFFDYVYLLSDNYSKVENIILKIDISDLKEEVADFNVYFTALDENNNKINSELLVKLREFVGPQIIGDDYFTLEVGSEVDLSSFVEVVDEYDVDVADRLIIDSFDFDINEVGIYEVKYTCFNTSGIYSEKIITIEVVDSFNEIVEEKDNIMVDLVKSDLFKYFVLGIVVVTSLIIVFKKKKIKH